MAGPDIWAAGLLPGGMGSGKDMEEARRRYEILKAELEAIRRGTKTANRAELRRLERELKAAQEAMRQAQAAMPPPVTGPVGQPSAMRAPAPRAARAAATPSMPTGAIRGPIARPSVPAARVGGTPGGALGVTTPRGYASRATGAQGGSPLFGSTAAVTAGAQPGGQPAGGGILGWIQNLLGGGATPGGMGAAVGGMAGGITPGSGARTGTRTTPGPGPAVPGLSTEGQYYKDYLAQQQAATAKTEAYRQQQLAHQKAQLQQAWAIAQQDLAQAQKVMAAQIGMGAAELQGEMWGKALPYALPRGTSVAPGFERGGPMQQLHRMSGSQFAPGRTGAISPYPQPSMDQIMGWVQQAMGKYGPGGR